MTGGPDDLNEEFVRSLPDEGPVVMVNLVRFRERSLDGSGSGWDAYARYSKADIPLLKRVGGTILWAGHVEGVAFGNARPPRPHHGGGVPGRGPSDRRPPTPSGQLTPATPPVL
jgi:hypothetical protein